MPPRFGAVVRSRCSVWLNPAHAPTCRRQRRRTENRVPHLPPIRFGDRPFSGGPRSREFPALDRRFEDALADDEPGVTGRPFQDGRPCADCWFPAGRRGAASVTGPALDPATRTGGLGLSAPLLGDFCRCRLVPADDPVAVMDNHNDDRYTVAEERRVVYVTSTAPGTTMVGHLDVARVGGSEKRRDHVATSPSSTACTDINELRAREHGRTTRLMPGLAEMPISARRNGCFAVIGTAVRASALFRHQCPGADDNDIRMCAPGSLNRPAWCRPRIDSQAHERGHPFVPGASDHESV